MKFIAYISILAGLFVTINSCRKEQPAMKTLNEDCSCANEVSADFWMEEKYGFEPHEKYTETDSIFAAKVVRFRAKEQNAEYTWYLGAETEQGVASVERKFPASFIGQILPITLVVKKNRITFASHMMTVTIL